MIFQDALSSLNPVFPVGWQIAEMFRKHRGMNKSDSLDRAVGLMERVQIPAARQRVKAFPHQFSGGMRQRIMIAMAIALDPAVLIADEPTTALDVTVQAQVMKLLKELQDERQMGLILITHDLGVVADVADRIAVMYAGRIVEPAEIFPLYANPAHPVHQGPAGIDPAAGPEGPGAGRDRRVAAQSDQDPAGLPLQSALQVRSGCLPGGSAAAAAGGGAPPTGRPATSPSTCWPAGDAEIDPGGTKTAIRWTGHATTSGPSPRRSTEEVHAHERRGHPAGGEPGQVLPDQGRRASAYRRPCQGGRRRLVRPAQGRDVGHRRRIGLREVDPGSDADAAGGTDRRAS